MRIAETPVLMANGESLVSQLPRSSLDEFQGDVDRLACFRNNRTLQILLLGSVGVLAATNFCAPH